MDLSYVREHPHLLRSFLTHQRIRETPVDGGSICRASRLTFDDGESLFTKEWPSATPPEGFFHAEASGLRWLRETKTVAVPEVLAQTSDLIALAWVEPGAATAKAAEDFGRALAQLHRVGAASFGAPWLGYHGSASMDNTLSHDPWHVWYSQRRLLAYLGRSVDRKALTSADAARVHRVVSNLDASWDEAPSRIHGDLWTGNLLWGADGQCWLVDPAAHGGHRETDLAYLHLWGGAPQLRRVLDAYREAWPPAVGWEDRLAVHELSMYLLHTALFGEAFASGVRDTLRRCP